MILNIRKRELDHKKLGEYETLALALLSNNYCISKEEIMQYLFKFKVNDYVIEDTIRRLRHKGLRIRTKYRIGYVLDDEIYIDY